MKSVRLLAVLCFFTWNAFGQSVKSDNNEFFRQKEDSLLYWGEKIIDGSRPGERMYADSIFTRILVRALKEPGSFYYAFDSVYTVSHLYSPDSVFRIITWQLEIGPDRFRQRGTIQINTDDGSLKMFPLTDKSDLIGNYEDTITDHTAWIGAVYYNIIPKTWKGKKLYALLGYDENDAMSNKKIIEVLDISGDKPVFGKFLFSGKKCARYVMEYKKSAGPRLNYDPELDLIIFEHLISESGEPNKKYTLVGDGDYEAFKWSQEQWLYIPKLFDYVTPENQEPVPVPMTENKLKFDEEPADPADKKNKKGKKN